MNYDNILKDKYSFLKKFYLIDFWQLIKIYLINCFQTLINYIKFLIVKMVCF